MNNVQPLTAIPMSVLIYLGGQPPSKTLSQRVASRASLIIAADSGYHACRDTDVVPDIVTGDFDSIDEIPDSASSKVVEAPEQDATDFEKALRWVPMATSMLEILGGTGLRSDHFLTNLLIAASRPETEQVVFRDDVQSIFRVTGDCSISREVLPATTVSLIPFTLCKGVTTKGLHWDLDNAGMGPGLQLGQSNRMDATRLSVSIQEGCLYVILNTPAD
jgi:thiamine pyrophosphokinase